MEGMTTGSPDRFTATILHFYKGTDKNENGRFGASLPASQAIPLERTRVRRQTQEREKEGKTHKSWRESCGKLHKRRKTSRGRGEGSIEEF
jgi:hypothetical protein